MFHLLSASTVGFLGPAVQHVLSSRAYPTRRILSTVTLQREEELQLEECLVGDRSPGVISLSSLVAFNEDVRSPRRCTNIVVVKFYQDSCRACRALGPKFDALAQDHPSAAFFQVNIKSGRQIFQQEAVSQMPAVLIYCGNVGRINGLGTSKQLASSVRDTLKMVKDNPTKAERLAALLPTDLDPFIRYADIIDVLRAVRRAQLLLDDAARDRAKRLAADGMPPESPGEGVAAAIEDALAQADPRLTERARVLFSCFDRRGVGEVNVDDLVAVTEALAACSSSEICMISDVQIAPSRLAAAGIAFERPPLEARISALREACAAGPNGCSTVTEGALGLVEFTALLALHEWGEFKISKQPLTKKYRAAWAILDENGEGSVPIANAAASVAATLRALGEDIYPSGATADATRSEPRALEAVLDAFDLDDSNMLTGAKFESVLARTPIMLG